MRKKHAALILMLVFCLPLLASCHGKVNRESFAVPTEFDENSPVEITFWAKNDTNKVQTAIYTKAIADFQNIYPNVKVNIRLYTDYSRIYNDVITNISTNTTPDVCITYPDHIATYITGDNVVVPLDELMADPYYGLGGSRLKFEGPAREEIVPQFLNECRIGESFYALPYMRSTEAVYINKTMVEKLGYQVPDILTWDFVWEVSEAAMAKNEDGTFALNGQKTLIPFIYKSTDNMMISMLQQLGAGYSNDQAEILIFNDSTKKLLEEIYVHAKNRSFSTFAISSYPGNFLNAGQCIFAIDSTAGATWMGSEAPLMDIPEEQLVSFETVVRPIPQYDTENPLMISQGPSVCVFSKENQQEVLASWLFAQYLLSDEVQIAYAETEGYVPVTTRARNSEQYQDYMARKGEDNEDHYAVKIEASQLLLDNLDHTFVTPVFNGSASLRQAAGQMIEETAKAARRKKDMNDAFIEALYSDMNSLYRLDQVSAVGQGTGEKARARGDNGGLPPESVGLLAAIAGVWIIIGIFKLREAGKKKAGKV